jgi:hypothetical protein
MFHMHPRGMKVIRAKVAVKGEKYVKASNR